MLSERGILSPLTSVYISHFTDNHFPQTLVFTDTKRMADDIASELKGNGWPVASMHGDKRQEDREYILSQFKNGHILVLIATDVASRGIGTCSLQWDKITINFF